MEHFLTGSKLMIPNVILLESIRLEYINNNFYTTKVKNTNTTVQHEMI